MVEFLGSFNWLGNWFQLTVGKLCPKVFFFVLPHPHKSGEQLLNDLEMMILSLKREKESSLLLREGAAFAAGKAWNRNLEGCSDWPHYTQMLFMGKKTARQRAPENKRLTSGHREYEWMKNFQFSGETSYFLWKKLIVHTFQTGWCRVGWGGEGYFWVLIVLHLAIVWEKFFYVPSPQE